MHVLSTVEDDGSAKMTVSLGDDDYRFTVSQEDSKAIVEYEETLTWRGKIRVKEPDDDIFKRLMVSDEMTEYLDEEDLSAVKRAKTP